MTTIDAAIAVNRFGLGARPGELAAAAADPRGWLMRQVPDAAAFRLEGADLPARADAANALATFLQSRVVRRELARQQPGAMADGMADGSGQAPEDAEREIREYTQAIREIAMREIAARSNHGIATSAPFAERLVPFWSNHFTVAASKLVAIPFLGLHEREVIRAGMTGTFADLLLASVRHPAMLIYLDQWQSAGPNSLAGEFRNLGLNENLAREILELHTLGPQGGYTQADVTEFARALTGWTVMSGRLRRALGIDADDGTFVFVPEMHEPGPRTVLGKTYPAGGEEQAQAILADLAAHPSTAKQVARQLARHFVADEPPAAAVAALEDAYRRSGGALPALHEALVGLPEAWAPESRKFKTPIEFLLSSLRAVGLPRVEQRPLLGAHEALGQMPFRAPSPKGWPDTAESWSGPDALMKRLEWSQALAERIGDRVRPEDMIAGALGPMLQPATRTAVQRAESAAQGLVLALMSPEFQRR